MKMRKNVIVITLITALLLMPLSTAALSQENGWNYAFSPYLWFTGLDGSITARGETFPVDISFSDALDDLELAIMFRFEGWKNRWGYYMETFFIDTTSRVTTNGTLLLKVDVDMWIIDLGAGYRIHEFTTEKGLPGTFDLLAGIRYYDSGTDLFIIETGNFSSGTDWTDFVIGGRFSYPISEKWTFRMRGDLAFGGSDLTWNAVAAFDYKWKEKWSLLIGYRILDIDYEEGSGANRKAFDIRMDGPALALTYRW